MYYLTTKRLILLNLDRELFGKDLEFRAFASDMWTGGVAMKSKDT